MKKEAVLEGLLFVVGDEGINLESICEILEINEKKAKEYLKKLQDEYEREERGIRISFLGGFFKLTTKKEHKEYYQKLLTTKSAQGLSQAALETLAIVAYNQPITRVEVDEIRGIASINIIRKLLAKDLIKVSGKSSMPGKPNLYRTTSEFLDYLGLASINDLPEIPKIEDDDEEKELFSSIYKED